MSTMFALVLTVSMLTGGIWLLKSRRLTLIFTRPSGMQ